MKVNNFEPEYEPKFPALLFIKIGSKFKGKEGIEKLSGRGRKDVYSLKLSSTKQLNELSPELIESVAWAVVADTETRTGAKAVKKLKSLLPNADRFGLMTQKGLSPIVNRKFDFTIKVPQSEELYYPLTFFGVFFGWNSFKDSLREFHLKHKVRKEYEVNIINTTADTIENGKISLPDNARGQMQRVLVNFGIEGLTGKVSESLSRSFKEGKIFYRSDLHKNDREPGRVKIVGMTCVIPGADNFETTDIKCPSCGKSKLTAVVTQEHGTSFYVCRRCCVEYALENKIGKKYMLRNVSRINYGYGKLYNA